MSKPLGVPKSTSAQEDKQRRDVRARDKGVCQFEVLCGEKKWLPCGRKHATDTAHLIRRPHLSPRSKFHEDLAILACRDCHTGFDQYTGEVRAPYDLALKAWKTACELSKVDPPIRYNPLENEIYK